MSVTPQMTLGSVQLGVSPMRNVLPMAAAHVASAGSAMHSGATPMASADSFTNSPNTSGSAIKGKGDRT